MSRSWIFVKISQHLKVKRNMKKPALSRIKKWCRPKSGWCTENFTAIVRNFAKEPSISISRSSQAFGIFSWVVWHILHFAKCNQNKIGIQHFIINVRQWVVRSWHWFLCKINFNNDTHLTLVRLSMKITKNKFVKVFGDCCF